MPYQTVFEISHESFHWAYPAWEFGATAAAAGFAWLGKRIKLRNWQIGYVVTGAALLLFTTGTWGDYTNFRRLHKAYQNGQYSIVEGEIEDFVPYQAHNHDECFSIKGVRFCYSDVNPTPGFHTIRENGGPLHSGLRVRIAYVSDDILRIEVLN
jgi:hypothetical protein